MAQKIADRVRETTTTTGTGSIALAGAVTGYQSFSSVLITGDTTYYCVADQGGANWEVGIGTFTSPSTLARTTILSSSNSGSIVTFTTGSKDVFITEPAAALTAPIISGGTIDNSVIGGITPAAATVSSLTLGGYANNKKIFETANNYLTILNGNGADSDFTIDANGSAAVRGSLQVFSNLNISGVVATGTWNGTAIAILYGGTGATTAAGARTNLGLGGAAVLNVGTTAGTVAAGDDIRIVGNAAVTSTTGDAGVTVQFITSDARQILMRWRDSVAAAASGVANAWAGLEVAIGIKSPMVNASQALTVNAETLTGANDGQTAFRITDRAGWIIARLWLNGLWEVPSLLVRGAATFSGAAGLAVQKLAVGAEAMLSTTRALSLLTLEDPAGRIVMRVLKTGQLQVPSLKASGVVVASDFFTRDPQTITQVGVTSASITALNANLPTMPAGLPPSPTFSNAVATYGPTRRYGAESMGVAVTGRRVWAAFYGQNLFPATGAEQDRSYVGVAYCDNYPAGPWTECLYALPTTYTGSGGDVSSGSNIDPVLYATPDGRLLVMFKATGITDVPDTVVTNTAVMGFLIQNPQASTGSFIVGRMNYLGIGRPEAPGVLGNDVYMLNDAAAGVVTWGRLTASGADTITYTAINTLPTFGAPASQSIECSWAPLSGGRVMALFRTLDGLYTLTSTPGVAGWGTPTKWTAWSNPSGGTPNGARAAIMRSPDSGRMIIAFNNDSTYRYNMSITLSEDDGATWPYLAKIDTTRGKGAYPALAYDGAGRILLTEDYNRGLSTQELIVWRVDEQSIINGSPLIQKSLVSLGMAS